MGAHRFETHTGEVRVELEGASLAAVFVEAGRALAELLTTEPAQVPTKSERIEVHAPDREALLVEWIDTLVFHSERDKAVFTAFEIESINDTGLVARVQGGEPGSIRTAVKAATFHRLKVTEGPGSWKATVVLDV